MSGRQFLLLFGTLVVFLVTAATAQKQSRNNPPRVKIIIPENNEVVTWNEQIRYIITVSDQEDGESRYQEINVNEVFIEVAYFPDVTASSQFMEERQNIVSDPEGLESIKRSSCFTCHSSKTRLTGPSLLEIAQRYKPDQSTVKILASRIISGSSDIWGTEIMPAHPDITQQQAEEMVKWILENAGVRNGSIYVGTEGSFQTRTKTESDVRGVYVLIASYIDHGTRENPEKRLRGEDMVRLYIE